MFRYAEINLGACLFKENVSLNINSRKSHRSIRQIKCQLPSSSRKSQENKKSIYPVIQLAALPAVLISKASKLGHENATQAKSVASTSLHQRKRIQLSDIPAKLWMYYILRKNKTKQNLPFISWLNQHYHPALSKFNKQIFNINAQQVNYIKMQYYHWFVIRPQKINWKQQLLLQQHQGKINVKGNLSRISNQESLL